MKSESDQHGDAKPESDRDSDMSKAILRSDDKSKAKKDGIRFALGEGWVGHLMTALTCLATVLIAIRGFNQAVQTNFISTTDAKMADAYLGLAPCYGEVFGIVGDLAVMDPKDIPSHRLEAQRALGKLTRAFTIQTAKSYPAMDEQGIYLAEDAWIKLTDSAQTLLSLSANKSPEALAKCRQTQDRIWEETDRLRFDLLRQVRMRLGTDLVLQRRSQELGIPMTAFEAHVNFDDIRKKMKDRWRAFPYSWDGEKDKSK